MHPTDDLVTESRVVASRLVPDSLQVTQCTQVREAGQHCKEDTQCLQLAQEGPSGTAVYRRMVSSIMWAAIPSAWCLAVLQAMPTQLAPLDEDPGPRPAGLAQLRERGAHHS